MFFGAEKKWGTTVIRPKGFEYQSAVSVVLMVPSLPTGEAERPRVKLRAFGEQRSVQRRMHATG